MATTVAQHSVATFTSPVNGTTPIDANTVRGNDNTVRSSYNDHDADPGIHVQSSTLASRPVAGTAGRKWITEDSGVYTLWFDDGTNWHPVSSEAVALTVYATETLAKGDVVKVTGWNNGQDLPEVAKVASASDVAFAVMTAATSSGTMGYATNTGILQDIATNSFSVGDILYPNTSGGFTSTKPTSGNYQPVAFVLRSNLNNGVIYVEFSAPRIVEASTNTASTIVRRDSNGDFSAGTITATAVNATTLDLTNLEVTNIKAKDGTQAIAIADSTGKLTISDGVLLSALTASQAVFTDASKNLVSNAITGTGNVVMSASPTLTGTVSAATINATTLGGTLSTAAQTNITSVGTLSSLTVSGNITSSGAGSQILLTGSTRNAALRVTGSTLEFRDATGGINLATLGLASGAFSALYDMTVSGNLTVDTDTLYVDATNNRVGVGTSSPAAKLHVANSSSSVLISQDGTKATLVGTDAAGTASNELFLRGFPLTFTGNGGGGATHMTLNASGNLGLGVTPSAWGSGLKALQIGSLGGASLLGYANAAEIGYNFYFDNVGYKYGASAASTQIQFGAGEIRFKVAPSGTADAAITFTQAMTLDASGNLVVGAASGNFNVNNQAISVSSAQSGTTSAAIDVRGYATSDATIGQITFFNASNLLALVSCARRGANNSGTLEFYTTNAGTLAERARIDASGYLLVNGTQQYTRVTIKGSAGVSNGYGILGATASTGCYFGAISATANDDFEIWNERDGYLRFATNNTERARIKAGGQFRFVPLAAAPAGAENGDVYYDSTTNKLRVYAGGAWTDLH